MMQNNATSIAGFLLLGLMLFNPAYADISNGANEVIRSTTNHMLQILKSRRAEINAKPQIIYELVDHIVVPNFDFERITQYAMGRFWRQADASEKQALVAEFQQLLIRTYAKALLNYSGQEVIILPLRASNRNDQTVVRTKVSEPSGPSIPIDYQMHLKGTAWKVYDVIIDGVSLVSNYRGSFAQEIRRGGVVGLIQALRNRNRSNNAG